MWKLGAKIRQFSDLSIVTPINLYEKWRKYLVIYPKTSIFASEFE